MDSLTSLDCCVDHFSCGHMQLFLIMLYSVLLFISLESSVLFIRPTALRCESNNCHMEEAKGINKYVVKLEAMNICFFSVGVVSGS